MVLCLGLDFVFPVKPPQNYSTIVLDNKGNMLSAYLNNEDKWRFLCQPDEVSPYFIKAILEKEDHYFYYHLGVNPFAILRAGFSNLQRNKRVSGASTITMQVVRMIYPQRRTYFNKLKEIIRAVQLEARFSKKEILAMYLNLIPFGSNIEGIKAASYIYLGKHPSKLNLAEALVLSIVPNKPSLLNPRKSGDALSQFKNKWLNKFEVEQVFATTDIRDARGQQVDLLRRQLPKIAPHFCDRMQATFPQKAYIQSTINTNIQLQIEKQTTAYLKRLESIGVKNAMTLVINNKTMEVVSYCGSSDYANTLDGGQVDGIRSLRSPGSTLKPYLYALAMEKGLVNPKAILYDIPSDFNGFKPENFDKIFTGQVSMQDALQQSLNIPAVKMLEQYGVNEFIVAMKKANFNSIKQNEDKLGLSMILGGCGVTMEEMIKLYATLANEGKYNGLKFEKESSNTSLFGKKTAPKTQLLSPAASYIIAETLSGLQRPDFPNNFDFTFRLPKIAWKTGTSFGKRDAWAFGFNPNFTVGVWLGNFSGESIPQLSGATAATPLLFQIFNTLGSNKSWFTMPSDLVKKEVCSITGLPKNEFCSSTQTDYFIDKVFYKNKCKHQKKIWTNLNKSMSYCNFCLDKSKAIEVEYINYPAEYTTFLNDNGMPFERIPPHNLACTHQTERHDLRIISPRNNSLYYIESGELELRASASAQTNWLLWYHNNKLLGKFKANTSVFIKPSVGKNTVSCTDEEGKTVAITFEAKFI